MCFRTALYMLLAGMLAAPCTARLSAAPPPGEPGPAEIAELLARPPATRSAPAREQAGEPQKPDLPPNVAKTPENRKLAIKILDAADELVAQRFKGIGKFSLQYDVQRDRTPLAVFTAVREKAEGSIKCELKPAPPNKRLKGWLESIFNRAQAPGLIIRQGYAAKHPRGYVIMNYPKADTREGHLIDKDGRLLMSFVDAGRRARSVYEFTYSAPPPEGRVSKMSWYFERQDVPVDAYRASLEDREEREGLTIPKTIRIQTTEAPFGVTGKPLYVATLKSAEVGDGGDLSGYAWDDLSKEVIRKMLAKNFDPSTVVGLASKASCTVDVQVATSTYGGNGAARLTYEWEDSEDDGELESGDVIVAAESINNSMIQPHVMEIIQQMQTETISGMASILTRAKIRCSKTEQGFSLLITPDKRFPALLRLAITKLSLDLSADHCPTQATIYMPNGSRTTIRYQFQKLGKYYLPRQTVQVQRIPTGLTITEQTVETYQQVQGIPVRKTLLRLKTIDTGQIKTQTRFQCACGNWKLTVREQPKRLLKTWKEQEESVGDLLQGHLR